MGGRDLPVTQRGGGDRRWPSGLGVCAGRWPELNEQPCLMWWARLFPGAKGSRLRCRRPGAQERSR